MKASRRSNSNAVLDSLRRTVWEERDSNMASFLMPWAALKYLRITSLWESILSQLATWIHSQLLALQRQHPTARVIIPLLLRLAVVPVDFEVLSLMSSFQTWRDSIQSS
jgi:hypothetical protein